MAMRAARMHGFNQPLQIDEVPVPDVGPNQVLIRVAATGMCRSDFQLVDGYFRQGLPVELPFIPGHEVAGTIATIGTGVPAAAGISEGDLVVVNPNWGDGTCRQCHEGNGQLCSNGQLVGFGPNGGFAEYMLAPYTQVISVADQPNQNPIYLAPLTDAGLTPYRGMKKLRDAGKLGAGRTVVVTGIGGLGSYGVQYARLLGGGATVLGFARSDQKLAVARENGADHTVNVRNKTVKDIQNELEDMTGRRTVDRGAGLCRIHRVTRVGSRHSRDRGRTVSGGIDGSARRASVVPFRERREVLLRLILGQLQRTQRSPHAGQPGTDQAQRRPGET